MATVILDVEYVRLWNFLESVISELDNIQFCGAGGDSTDALKHEAYVLKRYLRLSEEKMT